MDLQQQAAATATNKPATAPAASTSMDFGSNAARLAWLLPASIAGYAAMAPAAEEEPTARRAPTPYYGGTYPEYAWYNAPKSAPYAGQVRTESGVGTKTATWQDSTARTSVDGAAVTTTTDKRSIAAGSWSSEQSTLKSTPDHAAMAVAVDDALQRKVAALDAQIAADPTDEAVPGLVAERERARASIGMVTPDKAAAISASNQLDLETRNQEAGTISRSAIDTNLAAGDATFTAATTRVDGDVRTADTSAAKLHLGNGMALEHTGSSRTESTDSTGLVDEQGSSTTYGGGLVTSPNGAVGVAGKLGMSTTQGPSTTDLTLGGQLRDDGYLVTGEVGARDKRQLDTLDALGGRPVLESASKATFQHGITVERKPVADDPTRCDVVLTAVLGASLGLSTALKAAGDPANLGPAPGTDAAALPGAGATGRALSGELASKSSANGKLEGSLGARGTLVVSHRMTIAEADAYADSVHTLSIGGMAVGWPEFTTLNHLIQGESPSTLQDDIAGGLAVGDAVTLQLAVDGSLKGELGGSSKSGSELEGGSGSISAGVTASATRSVTLAATADAATGARRIDVTVGFGASGEASAALTGTMDVAKLGVDGKLSMASGSSATYRLDPEAPDYDTVLGRITGVMSPLGLAAIGDDPAVAAHLLATTATSSHGSIVGESAGVSALGFDASVRMQVGQSGSEAVTAGTDELSGTLTGERSFGATTTVLGVPVADATNRTKATANLADGGTLVLEETAAGSSFDPEFDPLGENTVAMAVTSGPVEALHETLTTAWTQVRAGTALAADDITALIARAGDTTRWVACAGVSAQIGVPWLALGRTLSAGAPVAEYVAIDVADAILLGRLRAIVAFVEGGGDLAYTALHNATWRWGAGADVLGVEYEWPASIAALRPEHDALAPEVDALPAKVASASPVAADIAFGDLRTRIELMSVTIANCADFASIPTRQRMLDALAVLSESVDVVEGRYASGDDVALPSPADGLRVLLADLTRLEGAMERYSASEATLFDRIRGCMASEQDSTWGAVCAEASWLADDTASASAIGDTIELYAAWVADIRRLRSVYLASATADCAVVSLSTADARTDGEPHGAELIRLIRADAAQRGAAGTETATVDRVTCVLDY
jgi:hypothetical protein